MQSNIAAAAAPQTCEVIGSPLAITDYSGAVALAQAWANRREAARALAAAFPKLQIAGAYSPPFGEWSEAEDLKIVERIAQSRADFVWVGLGCPKQEFWIARNKARLPAAVYSAVGAAFAFHAGRVKQAPAWLQRIGMEWAFRLAAEPRRLWRRYLGYNSLFVFY